MRQLIKRLLFPVLTRTYRIYRSKDRNYHHDGLKLTIPPTVFHPGHLISSKILSDYILNLDLKSRKVLDIGCGSGILGLVAAKSGAFVTAVDINPDAVQAAMQNAVQNNLEVDVIESDLLDRLEDRTYDFIFINPPYYPKDPTSNEDMAFYCGKNFEFFETLFLELPKHLEDSAQVFMILSEDCDIERVRKISHTNAFLFEEVLKKKKWFEWNYIFRITR